MIPSELQQSVTRAWPAVRAAVTAATDQSEPGLALRALKECVVRRTVPGTATDVPVSGSWSEWTEVPQGNVRLRERSYQPAPAHGLVELLVQHTVTRDDLDEIAAVGQGHNTLRSLAEQAVSQQLTYAVQMLSGGTEPVATVTLAEVVGAARGTLPPDDRNAALTLVVDKLVAEGLNKAALDEIRASLRGGSLVLVPAGISEGRALVLRHLPDDTVWYTAADLVPSWDSGLDMVTISIGSRLLLLQPQTAWRYHATIQAP